MGVEPEASRQFLNRRTTQHCAVVADDDRNLFHRDVKTIEQFLSAGIGIEIDISVRMSVAGKKLAQTQGLGGVARAHQNNVSLPPIDQRNPPQNEGTHENFAELLISGDQSSQIIAAHFQKFASLSHAAPRQARPARDHRDFPGELARPMLDDQALALQTRLHDFQASRQQHEKRDIAVARLKQNVADFHFPNFAGGTNTIDLVGSENRESLATKIS